jgi:hypothetical protein
VFLILQVTREYNGKRRMMLEVRSLHTYLEREGVKDCFSCRFLHRMNFSILTFILSSFFNRLPPSTSFFSSTSLPLRRTWSLVKLLEWIPTVSFLH